MCLKCGAGIVCKNCIEFFPEAIKNKFLTLKNKWTIIRISSIIVGFFSVLGLISFPGISDLGIPKIFYFVLIYLVFLFYKFSFYFIFKYFEDTTQNFLEDLKKNPQDHKNVLNEVYALYYDSFAHPESISNLKSYFLYTLIFGLILITFLFVITGIFNLI